MKESDDMACEWNEGNLYKLGDKFLEKVLYNMADGDNHTVQFGLMGEGVKPNYQIKNCPDDEIPKTFSGRNHKKYDLKDDNYGGWFKSKNISKPFSRDIIVKSLERVKIISLNQDVKNFEEKLDIEVSKSLNDTEKARRIRLATANKIPKYSSTSTIYFHRNPDVIAETLKRADGYCEECHSPAPFKKKSTGEPYLEVHHKKPLSENGEDTVENTIAVCPNCHRKAHFG